MVELFKDGSYSDVQNIKAAAEEMVGFSMNMLVRFFLNVIPWEVKQAVTGVQRVSVIRQIYQAKKVFAVKFNHYNETGCKDTFKDEHVWIDDVRMQQRTFPALY
jgi:hypothetical protein